MTHPGFLDQPFIKVPNPHPDEGVDFRTGEVVYSNPKAAEWCRLSLIGLGCFWFHNFVYWPMAGLYKTHIPLAAITDDGEPYMEYSMYALDSMSVGVLAYPGFFAASFYILLRLASLVTRSFVVKMQFNRSKDLLFISSVCEMGRMKETVHELANIEHVTSDLKASNVKQSAMAKGGFMVLKDLSDESEFFGRCSFNYSEDGPGQVERLGQGRVHGLRPQFVGRDLCV